MKKPYIIAYAMARGLDAMTEADAKKLTHVNLAFGLIDNGLLTMRGLPNIDRIETIRAWNPEIKIVLSIGGWGAGGFSTMAMTDDGRRAFAGSVKAVMDEHKLDGVDIDWEYPCNGEAGIDHDPRDRENFTHLMAALRDVAGERIVSIAAGAGSYFVRDTEMDKVAAICDYIQLMTYDMRAASSDITGHHTGVYDKLGDPKRISTDSTVTMFHEAGVPLEKTVIGAAFYSRRWEGVRNENDGLLQPAAGVATGGPRYGDLTRDYIDKNGWTRYWDDEAKAPYLFNGETFLSYDDPKSLHYKCELLKARGLLGIMYWEHVCDDTKALLGTLYHELREV